MWSKILKLSGVRAAKHWLRDATPEKKVENSKKIEENIRLLETALHSRKNTALLKETINRAESRGKIEGMKEGLDTYEFGIKIQHAERSAALQAIFTFVTRQLEKLEGDEEKLKDALTVENICEYLDRFVLRGSKPKRNVEVSVGPPPEWKCKTWVDALKENRKRTVKFIEDASADALSDRNTLLMAWRTWGRIGEKRTRLPARPRKEQGKQKRAQFEAAEKAMVAEYMAKYRPSKYAEMKEAAENVAKQAKLFPKDEE